MASISKNLSGDNIENALLLPKVNPLGNSHIGVECNDIDLAIIDLSGQIEFITTICIHADSVKIFANLALATRKQQ
jgi:hypothetical protein